MFAERVDVLMMIGTIEALILLAILLLLVIAVLFGLRKIFGGSGGKDALDISRERYARGEISREDPSSCAAT